MKNLFILSLLSLSLTSYANEMDKKRFEMRKADATKMTTKRIAELEKLKKCIKASTDQESLKNCHEAHRKQTMSAINARKAEREKMIKEHKKRKDKK